MARKTLLALVVSTAFAQHVSAAIPDIAAIAAAADLPPGGYRQDLSTGELRLIEPERYLVQLDTPALYPQLEHELRVQQPEQLAPDQALSHDSWQQLSFSQISAAQARLQNEQQLAKIQIQSRFPQVRVTGQFSQLENAITVMLTAPDKQQLVEQIAQLPGVKAIYPEQLVRAFLAQSMPKIEAPKVWEMQREGLPVKGKNIRVAILDTGVDYSHEALGGCFGAGCKVAGGYDFVAKDNDPMDVNGHGTHVASIVAGQSATITGVAPEASIYAYKVLADNGYGSNFDVISALEKAVDPDGDPQTRDGAQIINMSLGYSIRDPNDPLVLAVNNAAQAGALVVVAAGNAGHNSETVGVPGIAAAALTVANTEKNDRVNYSSSRGPGVVGAMFKPEMAAPGTDIYAAIPGNSYQQKTGTSMAAPHVAGAAALLLQANPTLSGAELKQRLTQNTDALKENFWAHGAGRLNVFKAMQQTLFFEQQGLFLGRVNAKDFALSGVGEVTLRNLSTESQDLTVSIKDVPEFMTVKTNVDKLTLAAGERKTLQVSYQVAADKVPENAPAAAVYQMNLVVDSAKTSASLPLLLEHYFPFRVNFSGRFNSLEVLNDKWSILAYAFNLYYQDRRDFKVTRRKVNLRAGVASIPAHLLPADRDPTLIVNKEALIHRTDVDVVANPEITLSDTDLKYRLRVKSPTRNGQPFWLTDYDTGWGNFNIWDDGRYIYGYSSFDACYAVCKPRTPKELYLSDMPATFSVLQQDNRMSKALDPGQLLILNSKFTAPWQTLDIDAEFANLNKLTLRQSGQSGQEFRMSVMGVSADVKKYNLTVWQKSVGFGEDDLPLHHIYFIDPNTKEVISSTQKWRLTDKGTLQRFRCKADTCSNAKLSDHTLVSSSAVRELSLDNNLRYLTSPLQADATWLMIKPSVRSDDIYYFSNVLNDLWQNDVSNISNLRLTQLCGDQQSVLSSLFRSVQKEPDFSYFSVNLLQSWNCKDSSFLLHYPLNGRDENGLQGEVRFVQAKAGLASPYFNNLAIFNQGVQGDTVSRIDNKFSVEVVSKQDPVKEFKVLLKTKDGEWKLAYHGYNAGVHQFPLPLRAGEHWLDLRLQVVTQSGNQLLNTMPEALRLGASAGGDNDVDSDGILNEADTDNDNDSIPDSSDAMPYNPTEILDSDQDGLGNNADPDDDNDGTPDVSDALPLDPKETLDTDKDGIGNNADPDDDNDGVADTADAFPLDPKETTDTDKDGIGNNADPDDDNDGTPDVSDVFPLDPKETLDTDKDGIGNNADPDDDNDGVADTADVFPLDPKETTDTDKDGIGNNADPDDDNDGVADGSDKYPLDASRSSDTVTPNAGSSGSGGSGGAGLGVLLIGLPLLAWRRQHGQVIRKAA